MESEEEDVCVGVGDGGRLDDLDGMCEVVSVVGGVVPTLLRLRVVTVAGGTLRERRGGSLYVRYRADLSQCPNNRYSSVIRP